MGECNNNFRRTAVQTLNEMMKKRGIMPQYECIHDGTETGDGLFTFRVTCSEYTAIGSGGSKKDARQIAAMSMINIINESEGSLFDRINGNVCRESESVANAIGVLQMLCSRESLPHPEYELIDEIGPNHAKFFTIECRVLKYKERGTGRIKQAAKHDAARKMISVLSERPKNSLKHSKEDISNVDENDGNLRNNNGMQMGKEQRRDDNCAIEKKMIPMINSNSAAIQAPLHPQIDRVKTINVVESTKPLRNEPKKVKLPTGSLVFQRKYIVRKLNDVYNRLNDPGNENTRDYISEIYEELKRLLQLLEIEPFQICKPTNNGKFMLAIYVPTDPQIIDAAVDVNEIDLKIVVYRRVIGVLLDSISRY